MIGYNTQLKRLKLPEYGRNIQQMVDFCRTIPDRNERNHCAQSIISSMGNLFPELRDNPDFTHKLWDHLALMADYDLDIDYPFEIVKPEDSKPHPISYSGSRMIFRHYGLMIQTLVQKAVELDDGPEKDELIRLTANHMKKLMLSVSKDGVEDERIFNDLCELSNGNIIIHPGQMCLHEFIEVNMPAGKKKKKK